MLNREVWSLLEAHGVTEAHLEMLLRLLEVQRNGSLAWHFVHGQVQQVDARIIVQSRRADLARASEALTIDCTTNHV